MGQRRAAGLRKAGNVWHIQKEIPGYGVIRESTHTGDLEKANEYLAYRLEEIRKQTLYGVRPVRYFAEAAARHIDQDRTVNKADNAAWLKQAMPYIGELTLDNVHDTTLAPFVAWCHGQRPPGIT